MKKKILACILSLLMLSTIIGCSQTPASSTDTGSTDSTVSTTDTGSEQTREEYVIDILLPGVQNLLSTDTPVGQVIKEKFNIAFNIIAYAGDYDEQVALMLSSNSYPEIVRLRFAEDIQKYVKAGALVELEELANECGATNFLSFHEESIKIWKLGSGDGKLYTWETQSPQIALNSDVIIRSDVLEAAGWPDVLTEDEYIEVLKIGLEKFPEINGQPTIGMTLPGAESYGIQGIMPIMYEKAGYTALGGNGAVIYNNAEDCFEDYFLNKYVKTSFRFFNRLYHEGILDPECFSDLDQQTTEKVVSGRALSVWYNRGNPGTANAAFREAGTPEMEYVHMPVMSQDQIDDGVNRCFREMQSYVWTSTAITKNAKYPERIMELLDYASTDEGQILLGWGIEGVHYTVDEDGVRTPTEEFLTNYDADSQYKYEQGIDDFEFLGTVGTPDSTGQYYQMWRSKSFQLMTSSDRQKEAYSHYGWETEEDIWFKNDRFDIEYVKSGVVNTTILDSTSTEGKLAQQLIDYRNKAAVELVMSDDFEATYTELVEGYKKLNPEIVIDAYNEVYEENKKVLE